MRPVVMSAFYEWILRIEQLQCRMLSKASVDGRRILSRKGDRIGIEDNKWFALGCVRAAAVKM